MDIKTLKKIEMKKDGKDAERFHALVKTVVNVPKRDVDVKTTKGKRTDVRGSLGR